MLFLNRRSDLSRRRGGLACAVFIDGGRLLGLLPGSPLSGGSGSPRLLRRRALPSSAGPFELIRLLLPRARGPASPNAASHGTTTTTRTTDVNIRNTGAVTKGAGATAAAPTSGALAATAGPLLRALEQQQRQHEQPPPPSKAWCSYFSGLGFAFVNE